MPPAAAVPPDLTFAPFLGRDVVAAGLLTRRQLQGRAWRRLFSDVYVSSALPLDHHTRCFAAALFAGDRGAVSGRSAAYLWGADVLPRDAPVELTVPKVVRLPAQPGLVVVRSALPPGDSGLCAGTPLTTPVRTGFDLARRLPIVEAVVGVDALLCARLLSRDELARFAAGRVGWAGLPQLRRVLKLADPGAQSPMESRLRLVLVGGGLPRPVTQFEVRDGNGVFVARLDLAYPAKKLGIEYEGAHHRGKGAFQQDLYRVNALRACGWTLLRFGWADIYRDPRRTIALVRAALAS